MKTIEKSIIYIKINIKKIAAYLLIICMAVAALLLVQPGKLFTEDGGSGKIGVKTEETAEVKTAETAGDKADRVADAKAKSIVKETAGGKAGIKTESKAEEKTGICEAIPVESDIDINQADIKGSGQTEPDEKAEDASHSNDAYACSILQSQKLGCKYYIENDFKRSIGSVLPYDTEKLQSKGGIVPHHLLADSLIAPFFKSLSVEKPDVVFIIGPNHKRIGQKQIHTGRWDWQTPFGVLQADDDVISGIIEECEGAEDFELLENDHSVAALIPYVKYYMPEAKVVPLLLHGNLGIKKSKLLAEQICKAAGNKKIVIVGSVDFSHYLPPDRADIMDEITLKAVKEKNFDAINQMGNDNLDCPPAIITVLEAMDIAGAKKMKVTGHSNSARIAGVHSDSTTSHFTIVFLKE